MQGRMFPRRDWLKGAGLGLLSLLGGRKATAWAGVETVPIDFPAESVAGQFTVCTPVITRDITSGPIDLAAHPGFFPGAALSLVGDVNREKFGPHDAGTLLFWGASTDRHCDDAGTVTTLGTVRFVARDRPWNEMVGADGAWSEYLDETGRPMHLRSDFAAELPGGAAILDGAKEGPREVGYVEVPAQCRFDWTV